MEGMQQAGSAGTTSGQAQYLTFSLGREEYGIEILRVQEIRGYSAPTSVPNTPPYIRGVMNLRGTVVPVVDLRVKLGMESAEQNQFTVVIVVNVGRRVVGMVVDSVSDVLNIAHSEMAPPPDMGGEVDTSFLTGIAKSGDRLISLLALDQVMGAGEPDEALAA